MNKLSMQSIKSAALGSKPEAAFVVFDNLGKRPRGICPEGRAFHRAIQLMSNTHFPNVPLAIDIVNCGTCLLDYSLPGRDADVFTV